MQEPDLDLLAQAAEVAGEIAMRHFRTDLDIRDKGDNQGPVTNADLAVDAALREILREARPDYGWLSEESTAGPDRATTRRSFVIDPIDGTRAYINGEKSFAHALAVVEDGIPVAAVVHMPAAGRTYAASLGGGATKNGAPITVSQAEVEADATVVCNKASLKPDLWPGGVPPLTRHFRPSLAYRLCLVAEGRFDAALTLHPAWDWDIAAGDLICREAGAKITTSLGKVPHYTPVDTRQPGILTAGPSLHKALMQRLSRPLA
ncbi:inositol monophosphatase family protein [Halovulum sp. GXIMD14793]